MCLTCRFVYRGGAEVACVGARGDRLAGAGVGGASGGIAGAQQRRGAAAVVTGPLRARGPRGPRARAGRGPRAHRLHTRTFQAPYHE